MNSKVKEVLAYLLTVGGSLGGGYAVFATHVASWSNSLIGVATLGLIATLLTNVHIDGRTVPAEIEQEVAALRIKVASFPGTKTMITDLNDIDPAIIQAVIAAYNKVK